MVMIQATTMPVGDAPAHGGDAPRRADADDRAGDGVRGRDRHAEPGREPNSVMAPPVSAQKPCIGVSRVIFEPIVFTMRQPPNSVPSPIAPGRRAPPRTARGTRRPR
jgi:hypothetical protein